MKAARWNSTLLAALFITSMVQMNALGLQPRMFGGQGIGSQTDNDDQPKSEKQWPKLLDFSSDKVEDENRFRLFGPKRDSFWKSNASADSSNDAGFFSGFPSLMPKRDPSEPNFFQKMNNRSKDMIDRTSSWAHEKNQNLRARTTSNWDSMTKNLRPNSSPSSHQAPSQFGAQPSIRTAEDLESRPSVRF